MPDMMRILYNMVDREARRSPEKLASRGLRVAVYGGANLDIQARSRARYRPADSNPGSVEAIPGGVGRNIAENLARLGLAVELVAALGDDAAAVAIEASCRAAGIGLDRSLRLQGVPTPQYICLLDADGRLVGAVAAMDAMERFGPEALAERTAAGDEADLVILDANLPAATIRAAAERWKGKPLILDTVSVAKAVRAAPVIGCFSAIKPNLAEARALLEARGIASAAEAASDAGAATRRVEPAAGTTGQAGRLGIDVGAGAARPGEPAPGPTPAVGIETAAGPPPAVDIEVAVGAARALLGLGVGEAFVSLGARGLLWAGRDGMGLVRPPALPVVNVSGAGDAATAALAWASLGGHPAGDKAAYAVAAAALCAAAPGPVDIRLSEESLIEAWRKVEHEPVP